MFQLFKFRSLLICTTFVIISCGKNITVDKNDDLQGYADSQVIGTWKITALTSDKPFDWDRNGTKETDIFSTYTACEKDNLYQFFPAKTGNFKLNCNASNPGTWQLYNSSLNFTPDGGFSELHTITGMSSNSFTSTKRVQFGAEVFVVTSTWTRQ